MQDFRECIPERLQSPGRGSRPLPVPRSCCGTSRVDIVYLRFSTLLQDQTVKASEIRDLEAELRKARDENAELRKRVNELSNVEAARKKAEAKTEQVEQKVCVNSCVRVSLFTDAKDGRNDTRASSTKGKRT